MIECIWEVVVHEAARGQFELAFGPGGAWSKLCSLADGFRGTTLLRDAQNPRRYLLFDLWDTLEQREKMMVEREAEFSGLEASFKEWAETRVELGVFRMLTEATVRPRGRTRRSTSGESRRGGGRRPR